jgi:O-antigen/teichoic acid export membrane protein
VRYVATLGAGTAIAQCFSIAVAPVITRLYTPADLGAYGLFTTFIGVAAVACSFKYELGIVSALGESEAAGLTFASILFCLPVSLLSGAILYLLIRNQWLGFGSLPRYAIAILVPTLFLTGVFTALRYWALRYERFGRISRATISQNAARSASQVAIGLLGTGALGLFWAELAGRSVGVLSMAKESLPYWWKEGNQLKNIVRALTHNFKLPTYSLPSSLIDTVAATATLPLIVQLYGAHAGGQFALLQRVLAVPLVLVSASVADAFHSRVALCVRDTPGQVLTLFNRTSAALLLLGIAPALVLGMAGEPLFKFAFGGAWSAAGRLASISAPWFLAQFVVSPLSRLVFVLRGQEAKLAYDVALLLGVIGTYEFARLRHLTMFNTVAVLTIVNAVAYLIYYGILRHIVRKSTFRAPRVQAFES